MAWKVWAHEGRPLRAGSLLLALFALTAARAAAPPDGRLQRTVHECQDAGPLKDYLRRLTERTDVEHAATAPFDQRHLVAVGVQGSLARLQRAVAGLYGLTWHPSSAHPLRYVLGASQQDRTQRDRLQAALSHRRQQRLRDRWEEVRRMTLMTDAQLRALEASGEQKGRTLRSKRTRNASRLAFGLPEGLLDQFWTTGRLTYPVSALPPEARGLASSVWKGDRSDLSGDEILTGTLRLTLGGTPDRPTVWLALTDGRGGNDTNLLYAEGWTRQPPEERRREARARPSSAPKDPRFKRKVTLKEPASRSGVQRGERPPGAKPLGVLLQDLGRQVAMPILAECEHKLPKDDPDTRWLRRQWWLAADIVQRPLPEALDLLCADFEYDWRFEDGCLLLRPRLWFLEPEERESLYPR